MCEIWELMSANMRIVFISYLWTVTPLQLLTRVNKTGGAKGKQHNNIWQKNERQKTNKDTGER